MGPQIAKKQPPPVGEGCPENPGFRLSSYFRRRLATQASPSSASAPGAGTPEPSKEYA